MSVPPTYRVEHRRPRRSTVLAVASGAKPHWRALDPYVSRLIHEGEAGWIVLVDEATGQVVTRRPIERATAAVDPGASIASS